MPSGAIAGPTSLRMAAAIALGRIAISVMVMSPPIDVPRNMARSILERGHHFHHVASVDRRPVIFRVGIALRLAAAANIRDDNPSAPSRDDRRDILEILRIAGQPVQADDRKPSPFARGRIVAGKEGSGRRVTSSAAHQMVGILPWIRNRGGRTRGPAPRASARSKLVAEAQEDLSRIAVEGRQHPFAAERGDKIAGRDSLAAN